MDHFLMVDRRTESFLSEELFPSIYTGKVVLFLGAGASITERKYLSNHLIEYYQNILGIDAQTNDLLDFMDIISSRPDFNRDKFDNYITDLLGKLSPSETHKIIAGANWCQIITTNLDLLLERAYDQIVGTSRQNKGFKVVRSVNEFSGTVSNDFIKYIKINGCISDSKKYPYVFSRKDFEWAKPYHRLALQSFSDLSIDVKFLTIGYSYSDAFARSMLTHFDSFRYRYKRPIISLDPGVPEARLDFMKENGIIALKLTTEDLFQRYQEWVERYADTIAKRKGINFTNKRNQTISLSKELKLSLGSNLVQLADNSRVQSCPPEQFYQGEKPTYDAIRRNHDVIKAEKLAEVKKQVLTVLNKSEDKLIPVIFLTGYFGSGKSTFLYRLIHSILHEQSLECVAFELFDIDKVRTQDIGELLKRTEATYVVLTCQEIEQDSVFKELMALRTRLSAEQFSFFQIVLLVSIRENILQKFQRTTSYSNTVCINIDAPFNAAQVDDLISKLESNNLLRLRDASERKGLASRILNEYDGDSFISLFSVLRNKNFELTVEDAYSQLSKKAKEAFIFTSVLYQYKIQMPSALLMRLISKDWNTFEDEILRYDSKEILIQERAEHRNGEPDLFFRTKHPVISQILIQRVVKTEDALFEYAKKIITQLTDTDRSAELFVNFIKASSAENAFQSIKVDKLFDLADSVFSTNPHFVLHYAMNLQRRKEEQAIRKGINRIIMAEGALDRRNHRLVHRRAVLNYELAKITLKRESEAIKTMSFINEARELFEIKRIEDPFSSFSYADFINLELWVLNNIVLPEKDLLILHIKIQDLFDVAARAVYEDAERIARLKVKYLKHIESRRINGNQTLNEFLDELYQKDETRPYALILKYNYCVENEHFDAIGELIEELELFNDIEQVAMLLFKYYGRNLHTVLNRSKLFELIKINKTLVIRDALRYHFYSYIAESYNRNFSFSLQHIESISRLDAIVNPNLHAVWKKDNGEPETFLGIIVQGNFYFQIRISELQRTFYLLKESVSKFSPLLSQRYEVKLHFFVKGIRVELVRRIDNII